MKIIMMMAITLDGLIAKDKDHPATWTSKEDKKLFVEMTKQHGAMIMGSNTFATFPAPLKDRLHIVFSSQPHEDSENVKWVSGAPEQAVKLLESLGYESAVLIGGTATNSLFLKNKLIDEMLITIEPKLFGNGLSLFNKKVDLDLELLEIKQINQDSLALRYKINY